MVGWLIIIGIFVVPGLIGWIAEKVKEQREAERSRQRDEIAVNALTEYGLTNEAKNEVEQNFDYVIRNLWNNVIETQPYEFTTPNKVPRRQFELCSKCHSGYMVRRQGKYGHFLGCSNYPRCTNTKTDTVSNKRARSAEKNLIAKEFIKDLERAYS